MKPIDFRNETFAEIQDRLVEDRERVYLALQQIGASTTRRLAESMDLAPEFVRPRVTELVQMGAVDLVDRHGHEGVYRALLLGEWMDKVASEKERASCGEQMQLL